MADLAGFCASLADLYPPVGGIAPLWGRGRARALEMARVSLTNRKGGFAPLFFYPFSYFLSNTTERRASLWGSG